MCRLATTGLPCLSTVSCTLSGELALPVKLHKRDEKHSGKSKEGEACGSGQPAWKAAGLRGAFSLLRWEWSEGLSQLHRGASPLLVVLCP